MKKKIINSSDLKILINKLKKKGKKIVQCHGVFDLIHIGHLKHFKSAKNFGDILIVSVTPDKFVQKGFNRPYFNASQRLESLSSIEDIDYVILNSTKNAVDIIKKIKPNFYCKGPDYKNFKDDITNEIKNELKAVKRCGGKLVFSEDPMYSSSTILNNETKETSMIYADQTILATGGLGQLYLHSTNPLESRGDGIAMAWRAGGRCVNLHYIQFQLSCLNN